MEEISKTQMELAIRKLRRMAAEIEDVPTFRGISVEAFQQDEHLIMLCSVFANEWKKTEKKYYELLEPLLPKGRITVAIRHLEEILPEPPLWRKIWNKIIKGLA